MEPPSAPSRIVPCQRVEIELTSHSVERFNEHFRPCLDFAAAKEELQRLLERHAFLSYSRPSWVIPLGAQDSCVAYVEIEGVLALPLVPHAREHGVLVAKTCIARGCVTHAERAWRRSSRAKRRSRRRP